MYLAIVRFDRQKLSLHEILHSLREDQEYKRANSYSKISVPPFHLYVKAIEHLSSSSGFEVWTKVSLSLL